MSDEQPSTSPTSETSSSSSPEPATNTEPKYKVVSVDVYTKDEEPGKFLVSSTPTSNASKTHKVVRTFHDFQFLEQQLFHSGQELYGYIIPPFPNQLSHKDPNVIHETFSGKQLPGYGLYVSDEYQLFHWLRVVLLHPVFGHSGLIDSFLTEKNLPPPGKINKHLSLIKSIQDTIDSRKYAHKDCDVFFQNERDWSIKMADAMDQASDAFNQTINARHSLCQVLAHLSAALSLPLGDNTGLNKIALQINVTLSVAIDGFREFVEAETINGAATLGSSLNFWSKFVDAEKEMLKQRTCLLVDYEHANRYLDRYRGSHRAELEEMKLNTERVFENCSDVARDEIKRFQNLRTVDLLQSLKEFKQSQLAIAREHLEKLTELYTGCATELHASLLAHKERSERLNY